ncbi:hypothetical protein B0H14DRAFT_3505463 [Mycena olivaceomarginata]|nr:hypothetical protein B0H14DRAFT_3505463 [Mycena olivaceomarginata]
MSPLDTLKNGLEALKMTVKKRKDDILERMGRKEDISSVDALDRYDENIPPANIYDINQLEAMRLADLAWNEVSGKTMANCWVKGGILPANETIARVVQELEDEAEDDGVAELSQVLNELQLTGILQPANRLDTEHLIDVAEERMMEDVTDEDIFDAVMTATEGEQNREINHGDDDPADSPVILKPTRLAALQAAATLRSYLEDIDGPFARRLELGFNFY